VSAPAMSAAVTRRLSVAQLLRGAFAGLFRHPRHILKAGALPFAIALALGVADHFLPLAVLQLPTLYFGASALVLGLLWLFPMAVLTVSLTRQALLGPQAARSEILTRRVWICFAALAAFTCITLLAVVVFFGTMGAFGIWFRDLTTANRVLFLAAYLVLLILLLAGFARLSLIFPAAALGERVGPVTSWQLTRGNGVRLSAALTCVCLVIAMVAGAGVLGLRAASGVAEGFFIWLNINVLPVEYHYLPGYFVRSLPSLVWRALMVCFGSALMAGTFANAYAQLTGWGAPPQDVLERFE